MSHISVTINARAYRLACDDGQEAHLTRLAEDVDQRISQLREAFGEIGDMRLTVMAALTAVDELSEARTRIKALEQRMEILEDARSMATERTENSRRQAAASLDAAAQRIETIARALLADAEDDELPAMG